MRDLRKLPKSLKILLREYFSHIEYLNLLDISNTHKGLISGSGMTKILKVEEELKDKKTLNSIDLSHSKSKNQSFGKQTEKSEASIDVHYHFREKISASINTRIKELFKSISTSLRLKSPCLGVCKGNFLTPEEKPFLICEGR